MAHATFAAVEPAAKELAVKISRMLIDHDAAIFHYEPEENIEEIEHQSRDGFWAWTSGGFKVCAPAQLAHHHLQEESAPAPVRQYVAMISEQAATSWAERYPDRPPLLDCIHEQNEWASEAEEWESNAVDADSDCYYWKARVMFLDADDVNSGVKEPSVLVDCYLNTDLNYGRDHIPWLAAYGGKTDQTIGSYSATWPLRKFAKFQDKHIDAIVAAAERSLP